MHHQRYLLRPGRAGVFMAAALLMGFHARQVHHQRYLLQPSALEVFMTDRSNALLNLPTAEVRAPRPRSVAFPCASSAPLWSAGGAASLRAQPDACLHAWFIPAVLRNPPHRNAVALRADEAAGCTEPHRPCNRCPGVTIFQGDDLHANPILRAAHVRAGRLPGGRRAAHCRAGPPAQAGGGGAAAAALAALGAVQL